MEELYELYLEIYGKVKSGKGIGERVYEKYNGKERMWSKRSPEEKLAITLAIEHEKRKIGGLMSKEDFEEKIRELSEGKEEEDMIQ